MAANREKFREVSVVEHLIRLPRHRLSASDCACLAVECFVRIEDGLVPQSVVTDVLGDIFLTNSRNAKFSVIIENIAKRQAEPGLTATHEFSASQGQDREILPREPNASFSEQGYGGITTTRPSPRETHELQRILDRLGRLSYRPFKCFWTLYCVHDNKPSFSLSEHYFLHTNMDLAGREFHQIGFQWVLQFNVDGIKWVQRYAVHSLWLSFTKEKVKIPERFEGSEFKWTHDPFHPIEEMGKRIRLFAKRSMDPNVAMDLSGAVDTLLLCENRLGLRMTDFEAVGRVLFEDANSMTPPCMTWTIADLRRIILCESLGLETYGDPSELYEPGCGFGFVWFSRATHLQNGFFEAMKAEWINEERIGLAPSATGSLAG
jgi:hypothetical protein